MAKNYLNENDSNHGTGSVSSKLEGLSISIKVTILGTSKN